MISLICRIHKSQIHKKQRLEWRLLEVGGNGDIGQRVQTCSYMTNNFLGSNMWHGDCS